MKALRLIIESNYTKTNDQEFDDLNKTHAKLISHYTGYNADENAYMRDYTGASHGINNFHWKQHKGEEVSLVSKVPYEIRSQYIDSALAKHKTPMKLTVFSGVKGDPREKMNSEGVVHHPAYLSTSLNKRTGKDFGYDGEESGGVSGGTQYGVHHVLKIKVPRGHPGAYVDDFSKNKGEHEFILPRGMNLRHIRTQTFQTHNENQNYTEIIHEHHMEIV